LLFSIFQTNHFQEIFCKSNTSLKSNFLSFTALIIGSHNGCDDFCSIVQASTSNSSSDFLEKEIISVNSGFHFVIVPVLSSTTALIL
jgi:hypothetical protein